MNIASLKDRFFELYGHPEQSPRIFFAPGRVNLIGEHTDYNNGFVLPCALQYGTYLLIRSNASSDISMASENMPFRALFSADDLPKKIAGSWTNYPMGVINEFLLRNIPMQGFDMLFAGDIPNGAGLSSSASIEMVTAYAITVMLNATELEMIDLVKMAKSAENNFVGLNCGIMDMFAIGMGAADNAIFLNCGTLEYKRVAFILNGYKLVIINSNKQRGLADSKYNERVAECTQAVAELSAFHPVGNLSEISFMQFFKLQEKIGDERIRRRARHVISENQRVLNAVPVLLKGDILQFGALMNASHESLRDNYEVTGIELDTLVEEAQNFNGCIGARMTGAGFGGCTVNIVRSGDVDAFINVVGENYRARTSLTPEFYVAEASDGARELVR